MADSGATVAAATLPRPSRFSAFGSVVLFRGAVVMWLSLIVLIPLALLSVRAFDDGLGAFWDAVSAPGSVQALKLTLLTSLGVVIVNVIVGTIIAWVLVRDKFPGKNILNSIIDLPFALPTIVAGLTLLTLYGGNGPTPVDIAFTTAGIVLALLFVTLPFVVRAVQPTLLELDTDMEEAAASLGAGRLTVFRRIVLPNLAPAIFAGAALAFARAVGEFGSVVLIAGTAPDQQTAPIYIFTLIEYGNEVGAAAVSVVLLVISLGILLLIGFLGRRAYKYER